jgi:hypothetical protein
VRLGHGGFLHQEAARYRHLVYGSVILVAHLKHDGWDQGKIGVRNLGYRDFGVGLWPNSRTCRWHAMDSMIAAID